MINVEEKFLRKKSRSKLFEKTEGRLLILETGRILTAGSQHAPRMDRDKKMGRRVPHMAKPGSKRRGFAV